MPARISHARADTTVRARLDSATKAQAQEVLDEIGLSASDLIRLTFRRVAAERRVPFALEAPNQATRAAIRQLDQGGGEAFGSVDALMHELAG